MRKVALTVADLGLVAGDIINVELINSIGKPYDNPIDYVYSEKITIAAAILEIDLLENELVPLESSYELTLPSELTFKFKVPYSTVNLATHDLMSLLNIGSIAGIIHTKTQSLDRLFVKKLDLYFRGLDPHFTNAQKAIVDLYEYYADNVIDTAYTIDVIEMMDEYLSTLTGKIYV